jgi:hypothetical protein
VVGEGMEEMRAVERLQLDGQGLSGWGWLISHGRVS